MDPTKKEQSLLEDQGFTLLCYEIIRFLAAINR